jgi:hypothetical protein
VLATAVEVEPVELLPGSAQRGAHLQRALRAERVAPDVAGWIEHVVERHMPDDVEREEERDGNTSGGSC